MRGLLRSRSVPWIVLACILALYAISVVRLHPTNFFGFMEDDTIYFSSAQALSQHKGYILPSVPGAPPATKYPILYPWVLSWVWHWNPSFPANLRDAVGLNIFFGFFFLTAAFVFLRRMNGISGAEALAITTFCALHPFVTFYTANLLSEICFSALALWTLILSEDATKPESRVKIAILCGVLAGLSTELRFVGIAIIAGIALTALLRRAWRQFCAFSLSSGLFLIPGIWRALFRPPAAAKFSAVASSGWAHEWAYYMNYPAFYKMSVPNAHVFREMLAHNLGQLALGPSQYFLFPSLGPHVLAGFLLAVCALALISVGIMRQAQSEGCKAIYCTFCFFLLIALVWDYPMFTRFFIPFLPLIAAALFLEAKHDVLWGWNTLLRRRGFMDALLGRTMGLGISVAVLALVLNVLVRGRGVIAKASSDRGVILRSKREAYGWISRSTSAGCRIIAYEDGAAYQYTGREAMRPVTLTVESFYNEDVMRNELQHMMDVARAVDASYWIISDDDYRVDNITAGRGQKRRVKTLENALPLEFQSTDGSVRVYGLDCVEHSEASRCEAADRVLFPEAQPRSPAMSQ